ncbi:DUF2280 domain-containing protein [Pseudoduganella namucuonensis]|uniref:DUF2280 domain-containing protein n=1 Tax=Pseudoduganella namucuonensis TaxID=1035707 RepID=A0A1I7K944_9BURK|nr:DUF2280 domain-containing protein [Pseudoduganella namucuonensis]SFU93947.1 hypothetical protein SAMN05216552_1015122 [Pseudoduganella namucuonensis]
MPALPGYVSAYIVAALACYDTPAQVAAAVKERFGLALSRQRIEAYHPERRAGARLNATWRAMFYDVRARFHAELDNIPIACQAYRLRALDRIAGVAEDMGNLQLAMQVLEQAAREASNLDQAGRQQLTRPAGICG